MRKLSLKALKARLHYDPETGIFCWREPKSKRLGLQAGTVRDKGYRFIETSGSIFPAAILAWFYVTGQWPKDQIDHINRDKDDNRFVNLREATNAENKRNSEVRSDSVTGFKCVAWDRQRKQWRVKFQFPGETRQRWRGRFNQLSDAVMCANMHIAYTHGPFAHLNEVPGEWGHD